jgi:hypothetical protein
MTVAWEAHLQFLVACCFIFKQHLPEHHHDTPQLGIARQARRSMPRLGAHHEAARRVHVSARRTTWRCLSGPRTCPWGEHASQSGAAAFACKSTRSTGRWEGGRWAGGQQPQAGRGSERCLCPYSLVPCACLICLHRLPSATWMSQIKQHVYTSWTWIYNMDA